MRVFVTGATGFVGSHFVEAALRAGHDVVAHRRAGSAPRIPLSAEPRWTEVPFGELDAPALAGATVLVHLAAAGVSPQPATRSTCYDVNVCQSLRLVDVATDAGVARVVTSGTYAEYGLAGLRYDRIPADAPLEPTDPYAGSKAAFFTGVAEMCRSKKFELSYQRLFSVYGEGQFNRNLWPSLREAAQSGQDLPMTAGEQVRDFISVEKVAARLLEECERADLTPGVPWVENLASGQPRTVAEFAREWWARWNPTGQLLIGALPYRSGEVMRYVPETRARG